MKILKYIGIVMVVLLAAFLSLGLFVPSFEYSSSTTVTASPEKCWRVLHDTSRMNKWLPGFKKLTLTSGENMRPGAVYEIILVQDKLYVMQEKLKDVKAPELISYELTNDVMQSAYEFNLTTKNSQTEITSHYRVVGNNLIWRSLLLLSKSYLQKGAQEQLDLLKLEIETGEVEFE